MTQCSRLTVRERRCLRPALFVVHYPKQEGKWYYACWQHVQDALWDETAELWGVLDWQVHHLEKLPVKAPTRPSSSTSSK